MHVRVIAQQFAWHFQYLDEQGKPTTNTLYLPKDQPVKFDVVTRDVIHSFWVPSFRLKTDTVPGLTTSIRVTPNKYGNFDIVCAELCGLGHSTMRQTAHVVTPQVFSAWLPSSRRAERPEGIRPLAPPPRPVLQSPRPHGLEGKRDRNSDGRSRARGTSAPPGGGGRQPRTLRQKLLAPGLVPRRARDPDRHQLRLRPRRPAPRAQRLQAADRRQRDHHRLPDLHAARLPGRPRRVRLLVPLGLRRPDRARGPLRPRRLLLARLLPRQHRPQGDRAAVHLHHVRLLRDRRRDGDADARRARRARASSSSTRTPSTACSRCTPR